MIKKKGRGSMLEYGHGCELEHRPLRQLIGMKRPKPWEGREVLVFFFLNIDGVGEGGLRAIGEGILVG